MCVCDRVSTSDEELNCCSSLRMANHSINFFVNVPSLSKLHDSCILPSNPLDQSVCVCVNDTPFLTMLWILQLFQLSTLGIFSSSLYLSLYGCRASELCSYSCFFFNYKCSKISPSLALLGVLSLCTAAILL